jgi:putative peptidoglycan lipid II flippase
MKQALSLGAITGLNILVAALVQWYIVVMIGPGAATDALYAAAAAPQFLLAIIRNSLVVVLVPLLAGESEERILRNTGTVFVTTAVLFASMALVGGWLAPVWVPLLFPGFPASARALTVSLSRIQLGAMVFSALSSVLVASYQARRRFVWSLLTPLVGDFVALGVLVVTLHRSGIIAAAWAALLSELLQAVLLWPALRGLRQWVPDGSSMRALWGRLRLLLAGTAYFKTDPLVDRFLSSMSATGGFSLLYLGQQFYAAINLLIGKALAVPLLPALAVRAKAGDWRGFDRLYRARLRVVLALTVTAYAALLLFGKPALRLVIGHGAVTQQNVAQLWQLLAALGGVFIAGALGSLSTTAFYASGDTRTPTRLGIWTYTLFVPLKILLFLKYGLIGLAVASSLFVAANWILQHWWLRRCILRPNLHEGAQRS